PITSLPVRQFAGWSPTGTSLAYVTPEQDPGAADDSWAFLFPAGPRTRDRVLLAAGVGDDPGREVFSGMRVTFPHWSPTEDKLSVWFTFSPKYEMWSSPSSGIVAPTPPPAPASQAPPQSARRRWWMWGDPAAVLDVRTGEVSWLAVNASEKAQVGHY